ncbi:hypothetical protein BH23ACT6_BH23ACT6_06320 [soil metagenome]
MTHPFKCISELDGRPAATTARVADLPLSEPEVREAIRSGLEAGGWLDPAFCSPAESQDLVEDAWQRASMVAKHFTVGTVVGRRWTRYSVAGELGMLIAGVRPAVTHVGR